MQLPKLTPGRILRRYKRFLADVELASGELVTAHCPNTGSMRTCWEPGAPVELSHSDDPKRKLAWTLERVDMGSGWVGVHTGRTNPVMAEGIAEGLIPPLAGYAKLRREVRFELDGHPRSRLDLQLFEGPRADALVEVKNVSLLDAELVRFPDAVTERGRKHLDLLATAHALGWRAVMLFAVNRPEGRAFAPADEIDPAYARRLREVAGAGVELLAVRIEHGPGWMRAGALLPVDLGSGGSG
jgi:sugar fermentation stimulation protein A